jgi:hypothetical protein
MLVLQPEIMTRQNLSYSVPPAVSDKKMVCPEATAARAAKLKEYFMLSIISKE